MPFLTCRALLEYRVALQRYITTVGPVLERKSVSGGSDLGRSVQTRDMAKSGKSSIVGVNEFQRYVCSVVPPLDYNAHKGQCGRIGVIGGSDVFIGAPFYASMSAYRLGADLVYVFTTKNAAAALKSYSPELMVHPCLDNKEANKKLLTETLTKLHALVVGCGLSLEPEVQASVSFIIEREEFTFPQPAPDAVEALASNLGNVTIVAKGAVDIISDGLSLVVCDETGSPRRCGGQGDVLAGLLGTFSYWAFQAQSNGTLTSSCPLAPSIVASLGASMVTRRCARNAFKRMRRSTLTSDLVDEIRDSFAVLFPVD